jgi:invasion protein IalB
LSTLENFTHFSLTLGRVKTRGAKRGPKAGFSPGSRSKDRSETKSPSRLATDEGIHAMPLAASRTFRILAAGLGLSVALAAFGAVAETKPQDKAKDKAAAGKPALVGSYGDWSVFQSQSGKTRICYTLAQPKERVPEDAKRDPAYAFISERPGEGVRNEVSFIMGFDVASPAAAADAKDAKDKKKDKKKDPDVLAPSAVIGDATFDLLPKGADLWVKNAANESELIAQMRKGSKLVIKAASKKGAVTTDTYSLAGFSQAIDRALKDCPAN